MYQVLDTLRQTLNHVDRVLGQAAGGEEAEASLQTVVEASLQIEESTKPHVLIITREAETAISAVINAACQGFSIHVARNALSALADLVERGPKPFDAVITEVDFEFMGGLEAMTRIRGLPNAARLTIIVVRGSNESLRQSQIRAGGPLSSTLSDGSSRAFKESALRAGADFVVDSFAEIR